jgi:hypothetical protein
MIDPKQVEYVEHFSYLGSVIINDARCTRDIKSRISTAKEEESFHQQTRLEFKKRLVKYYIWRRATYGTESWTLRKVYQRYMESFEMWC